MDSGNAVYRTSQVGFRSPFFKAGIALLMDGNMEAKPANIRHHIETDANCTIVRVAGFGNAFRIDFDDVFVRAEVRYHTMQSACP